MQGVPVVAIVEGSIAEKAGVRVGDIIIAFNDKRTENLVDYVKAKMLNPTRESVLVERNGKRLYFEWENEKNQRTDMSRV